MEITRVKKYLTKIIELAPKILLGVLLFVMIWFYMSNSFDTDAGWHMRFGEAVLSGQFPYRDTLTWSYYGENWVNMSWGGDILFWWLYSTFGYQSQVILMTLVTFLAFLLVAALPNKKIHWVGMLISVFTLYLLDYTIIKRLAFFAPLFLVGLIYLLEGKIRKNIYLVLPIFFWAWAFLHGSWILGFITINIYLVGNLLQDIFHRHKSTVAPSAWNRADYLRIFFAEVISFLVIAINPYGFKLFLEIISVFTNPGPVKYIMEFTPSINYPIYFGSVIFSVVIFVFAMILGLRKKITFAQWLLVIIFFISGIRYKRNIYYILLIGIPIITSITIYVWGEISRSLFINFKFNKRLKELFFIVLCLGSLVLIYRFGSKINFNNDIWNKGSLARPIILPFTATKFLIENIDENEPRIFSEFNWTGYLEWMLPNAYYFLDGRTLRHPTKPGVSLVDDYYAYYYDEGGLGRLEERDIKYVLLRNVSSTPLANPDLLNRIFFGEKLKQAEEVGYSQLERDLRDSKKWYLLYTDRLANIWKRSN